MATNLLFIPPAGADPEFIARTFAGLTRKSGVIKEWRRSREFLPRGARARLKSAKAHRLRRRLFTHDGEPLFRIESERRRFGDA